MGILEISAERFEQIKNEAEIDFKSIGKIYCPYLKCHVNFNSKGLDHLKFKRFGHARSRSDQYMRLRLLKLAPSIINSSRTLQGYFKTKNFERQKSNNQWKQWMKSVEYFEFVSVIKNARIKIVVKKIEGGEPFFWSLIPFWKQTEYGKRLHDGDPEID